MFPEEALPGNFGAKYLDYCVCEEYMRLRKIKLAVVILSFAGQSHCLCKFISPKNGDELIKGQVISMEVTCSPLEIFAWDYKPDGPSLMGYFRPESDTVKFDAGNNLEEGSHKLYLFTVKSQVNPETGLIQDLRMFSDSVLVRVIGASAIEFKHNIKGNIQGGQVRNILGRLPGSRTGTKKGKDMGIVFFIKDSH